MKKLTLVIILPILTVIAVLITNHLIINSVKPITYPPRPFSEKLLFTYVNNFRKNNNLSPYIESETLCKIAEERSYQIRTQFSHAEFLEKYDYSPYVLSENIAAKWHGEKDTLGAWLTSPSHKKTLMADYKYSCIKCSQPDNYCVQIFSSL